MTEGNDPKPASPYMESIRARAALAAFEYPPPPNPYPVGSKEWEVWTAHLQGVLAARFEG